MRSPAGAGGRDLWALSYVAALCVLCLASFSLALHDEVLPDPATLAVILALALPLWWIGETTLTTGVTISMSSVLTLVASAAVGPVGGGVLGALFGLLARDRMPVIARVFNAALFSLAAQVAGWAYRFLEGSSLPVDLRGVGELMTGLALPLLAADILQALTNALLLSGIVRITEGVSVRMTLSRVLLRSGAISVGYGVLAFLLLVLWFPAGVGPVSALLILVPLWAAHWGYTQYDAQTRTQEQSLDLLVGALETKAPDLCGHSARVSDLAGRAAEHLGLSDGEVLDVRRAARLHDVGRLQHASGRRPRHAERTLVAAELVEGLTFLSGATEVLRSLSAVPGERSAPAQLISGAAALDRAVSREAGAESADEVIAGLQSGGLVSAPIADALLWAAGRSAGRGAR